VLSRIIYGSRISLAVSLVAIFVAGTLGTLVGLVSGYRGGAVDAFLMRLTDIGLSLPIVLIAVVMVAVSEPSFRNIILVISLLLWPRFARQIRGETLAVKEQDFVALAVVAGRSSTWIISRHIFPNVVPTLLVITTLQVGFVILLEGTLSFLGVGVPPPNPAWGLMIADGRGFLATAWWISLFPGAAMLLTVLAVNLMGDWLRDHLDPKLRQVGGRAEVLEAPMAAAIGGATDDAPARGRAAAGAAVDGN
jgi:peptide/nickel transport system permease protein